MLSLMALAPQTQSAREDAIIDGIGAPSHYVLCASTLTKPALTNALVHWRAPVQCVQELPPPKKLMVFADGYQAGAKHMWAADTRTELQDFLNEPSPVDLPPAMYEDCIGRCASVRNSVCV